jgi:ABC-type transporter Mla MlaB component
MTKKIQYIYEEFSNTGVFYISGDLTDEQEDELQLLLMRAIHSLDRAVLNLEKVTKIKPGSLALLRNAYCTSIRLKNPLILTQIPENYISEIYNCEIAGPSGTDRIPDYDKRAVSC